MTFTSSPDIHSQVRQDTPLLVNIKGCGYAPDINCGSFANKYQVGKKCALLDNRSCFLVVCPEERLSVVEKLRSNRFHVFKCILAQNEITIL